MTERPPERHAGAGSVLGGLGAPLVGQSYDQEVIRVHVEVAVEDPRSAGALIRMLLEEFDAAGVAFDAERRKVRIESDGNADRALIRALDVIERWVTICDGLPATVDVEGRSYTLGPSVSLGAAR